MKQDEIDSPQRPPSRGSNVSTELNDSTQDLEARGSSKASNSNKIVDWDGPDDPANPRNWSNLKKWTVVAMLSIITLMSTMGSSVVAPTVPFIAADLGLTTKLQIEMIISIYVLAFGIGPLFIGPLSEIYGRRGLMLIGNVIFLAFNVACSVSTNYGEMLTFRFLAALAGSGPLAIGAGMISDMFTAEKFGVAVNMYSLAPTLGPAVGPLVGSLIAQNLTWHWAFHIITIVDGAVLVLAIFFLSETFAPVLLERKAARQRTLTGDQDLHVAGGGTANKNVRELLVESVKRPFILLFTQPIVQIISFSMAYLYGILYLVIATFTQLWVVRYHQSLAISGVHFLSLGIGLIAGTVGSGPVMDRIYLRLRNSNDGTGLPEFRLPITILFSVLLPIGLFMYGWSAQNTVFWLAPDVGMMLFGLGFTVLFQALSVYTVDTYRRYAASAMASASFLRSAFGFAFPLFAQDMYDALDYGWGNSLLGFVAMLCFPASVLLYKYGGWLRARSAYAAG
ncbi:MFS multidrug transporter-like protein [Zopfochytrium polystomum]|nr:MFS multidrug transporter-like protein [Zopfochytrium polystomum]